MGASSQRSAPDVRGRPPVADRLLGLIGGVMVLAALLLFVFGGPSDGDASDASPPAILLLSPESGASVDTPLELTFRVPVRIGPSPAGWGTGGHHLHAEIDGREFMPGPGDIRQLESGTYRWTVQGVRPGSSAVRLFWSDRTHQPLSEGATPPVLLNIR
jgi:hypothetical protein